MSEFGRRFYRDLVMTVEGSVGTAEFEEKFEKFMEDYDQSLRIWYRVGSGKVKNTEGAPMIRLSEIPEDLREARIGQLAKKALEYEARIKSGIGDQDEITNMGHNFVRRAGLKILLELGELNTFAFTLALEKLLQHKVDDKTFISAWTVIKAYVLRGGEGLVGGTGLADDEV